MTLSTMIILGVTATIVLIKLAIVAFIVALATKTLVLGSKSAKPQAATARMPAPRTDKRR
ncbi:MAG: hypothetical protein PVF28_07300 [Thioalkalispiraceae bacterium]